MIDVIVVKIFVLDFHVLCVKNELKKDVDIMETLCDEHGNLYLIV